MLKIINSQRQARNHNTQTWFIKKKERKRGKNNHEMLWMLGEQCFFFHHFVMQQVFLPYKAIFCLKRPLHGFSNSWHEPVGENMPRLLKREPKKVKLLSLRVICRKRTKISPLSIPTFYTRLYAGGYKLTPNVCKILGATPSLI